MRRTARSSRTTSPLSCAKLWPCDACTEPRGPRRDRASLRARAQVMVFEQRPASDRTRTHDDSKTDELTDDDHASGDPDAEIRLLDSTDDVQRLMHLFNQVWGTNTAVVGMELIRAI